MTITITGNIATIASLSPEAVFIIQDVNEDEETILHTEFSDNFTYELPSDGYYRITEIILPSGGYYTDGTYFYNASAEVITTETLLDAVTAEDIEDFIHYNYLKTYYKDLLKNSFLKCICTCSGKEHANRKVIDTISMGIFLLELLIEEELLYEADRIINSLNTCNYINYSNCSCNG